MQPRVNDMAVRFANVNGSGSASANSMFARAMFRMGLPVSAKNIFPSNIQGAPTWYVVRVSESGFTGHTDETNLVVAMNAASFNNDVNGIAPGGVLVYDSTLERNIDRDDIDVIAVPLTKLTLEEYGNIKQRFLFKNLVCNGVLCVLLGMEEQVFVDLIKQEFARKPKLIEPNVRAFEIGVNYAKQQGLASSTGYSIERRQLVDNKIMVTGNEAAGLGACCAGATVCAWYPITPSTSVAEGFTKYAKMFRHIESEDGQTNNYAIVQAEDELAAMGMVIGAGWNGARGFTATSGPGVSLMSEFIGLAYFAEVPVVLVNVQRGGPSTGMPTRTQQSDLLSSAYASHGDTNHPLLFPASPTECFEMTIDCFDLADRLQTPVMLMSDLDIGMNDWVCDPFDMSLHQEWDRGKIVTAEQLDEWSDWGRYKDIDGDGIPWRSIPGTHPTKGAYLTRGTSHNEYGGYTEDGNVHREVLERINVKWETAKGLVPKAIWRSDTKSANDLVLYFGSSDPAVRELMAMLDHESNSYDYVRLRSYPFSDEFVERCAEYDRIFVVEQNRDAQMLKMLLAETKLSRENLISILSFDGMPPTAVHLYQQLEKYRPDMASDRMAG